MGLAFTGADEDGVAQPVDWYGTAVELDRSNRVKTTPKISILLIPLTQAMTCRGH